MAGIRVNTGAKKIEVNDKGDYITLNFSDQSFAPRFFEMLDRVLKKADEAKEREAEIKQRHEAGSIVFTRAMAELNQDVHRSAAEEIDSFFGEDTCNHVFGDIVPGIDLIDDFFQQLMPYFQEYSKERTERMSKYSAARTGNV